MPAAPSRHAAAADLLALRGGERVLEVGCGHGIALDLVCRRLGSGHATGLDRSPAMIRAAARRNAAHLAAGRARLVVAAIEDADLGGARFDRVLGVNVAAFVRAPGAVAPPVRRRLAPGGALCLVYEPPPGAGLGDLAGRIETALAPHGFRAVAMAATGTRRLPVLCAVLVPAA